MKLPTKPKVTPPQPQPTDGWLFKPVERPSFTDSLAFPDDITKLSGRDVSLLHGRYTALYAYAVSELAKVNVSILRIDSEIFRRKNNIARTCVTYGKNKFQTDAQIRLDKAHEDLQSNRAELSEKKETTERYLEIFDRYIAALSREMSRRQAEMTRT